jgi:hypothetical protein
MGLWPSKVLFVALQFDLFSRLSTTKKQREDLAQGTGIEAQQLLTLLTACLSMGLLTRDGEYYGNAPACEAYLARHASNYFGDYYRFQINRQIYPQLEHLETALKGATPPSLYALMDDVGEADHFNHAQRIQGNIDDHRTCLSAASAGSYNHHDPGGASRCDAEQTSSRRAG